MKRVATAAFAVLGWTLLSGSAWAAMCDGCKDMAFIMSVGTCSACGGMTSSGAHKLCAKCSTEQNKCQACGKPLKAAAAPKDEPPQGLIAPPKVDLSKDGTYQSGRWTYDVKLNDKGTRSEGVTGALKYDGKEVHPGAKANDWIRTPWGKLYWMGEAKVRFGRHGWMPEPAKGQPEGKELPPPDDAPKK